MRKKLSAYVAILWATYQLFIIVKPALVSLTGQRAIHLAFGLILLWINKPFKLKKWTPSASVQAFETVLLCALTSGMAFHMVTNAARLEFYAYNYTLMDKIVSVVGILLVLEGTRRVLGPALVIISGLFLAYGIWGKYIPGTFGHRGNTVVRLATKLFMTWDGVFGTVLGISASLVFAYLLFGGFLNVMGGGKFFTDISYAALGHKRGGPAKMAVISSCLFGSISGSAIANVVTTGSITIPLMKSLGYKPEFAGAVEAVASTGGQYMPPVMGATAFIMAQMMGVTYPEVVIAAIVSALLYYFALILMVDFEAAKNNMKGLPKESLPKIKDVMKEGWHFLVPFAIMLYFLLVVRYEAQYAALYAIISMVIMVILRNLKNVKEVGKQVIQAMVEGAESSIAVTVPCGCIGLVVGVVTTTGVGLEFSALMRSLSGGHLFPLLLIMMVACLILGLGVPTTAAYVLVSILAVPAMLELGVPLMAAHLFCFYFAVISVITPPVALAAFTAAGIAKANPFKTGWTATRLGIAGFIVPYVFVYQPGLLLMGTIPEILIAICSCTLGIFALSGALQQYMMGTLNKFETAVLYVVAICLVTPNTMLDVVGYVLMAAFLVYRHKKTNRPHIWRSETFL